MQNLLNSPYSLNTLNLLYSLNSSLNLGVLRSVKFRFNPLFFLLFGNKGLNELGRGYELSRLSELTVKRHKTLLQGASL